MDVAESLMSTPINPNNFPAKLWHLVNSPHYQSICWDSSGEGVIVDKPLFESELLRPSDPTNEASDWFKTTNFSSFIRQLNLYGFRKVVPVSAESPNSRHPGGDIGAGDGHLHHFYSAYFRKEHPELLVNLKRMTSSNKAKMAAGLKVNSRLPNRFQRLLTDSLVDQSNIGPMSIEQDHRIFRRDSHSPYFYGSPASCSHIGFPLKELDRTPTPPRQWPSSIGMLQGQLDSQSSFPGNNIIFPVLQRFPTDVKYTLSAVPTSSHSAMSGALQQYGSYVPPTAQYSHPYYPTAVLPCCTSQAHMECLVSCSGSALPSYQHCSYFQDDMDTSSNVSDKTLAIEQMKLLVSDVPSVTKLVQQEDLAETRGVSKVNKPSDLSLLVDVVCRQGQFTKEEELGESKT
ncbi:heat shock factor protein 5 isoform X2 [Pseudophryne corroboree]|uniref:heat shock factor protein 5 isoform X2 n=1 Tax=Pseudophryne corroboree TaxID=495146 RepID=UPI003081A4FB